MKPCLEVGHRGVFGACNPIAARFAWTVCERFPGWSGALATAGDVVFYGTMDGWFEAAHARTDAARSRPSRAAGGTRPTRGARWAEASTRPATSSSAGLIVWIPADALLTTVGLGLPGGVAGGVRAPREPRPVSPRGRRRGA
jgi:hypothetical protein